MNYLDMPNAKIHHRVAKITAIPLAISSIAVTLALDIPIEYALAGVIVFLFADKYLSPDLDFESYARSSWGWLYWLWYPYYTLIPHRSWLSHSGFMSSTLRLCYFSLILFPISLPIIYHAIQANWVLQLVKACGIVILFAGIADSLHVVLDIIYSLRWRKVKKWLNQMYFE